MPVQDSATKSPWSPLNLTEVGKYGQKQLDALIEMQKGICTVVEEANRNWLARLEVERELTSDLTTKLSNAKTLPDAAKVYQDWANHRMQLLTEDGQKVVADSQKLLSSATRFFSNGGNGAST